MGLEFKKLVNGEGVYYIWQQVILELSKLSKQLMTWATDKFVQSVNGKSGSSITIEKGDVGLGNVDNTADLDKHVAHAVSADNADTLDGKHAEDFLLKSEHEDFSSEISSSLSDLDARKVDKVDGKGLSSNDFTDEEKQKLAGIDVGAQKNTVTSVSGKIGDVIIDKEDVGLGNVDNTSDADKHVAHAATADNADTLDGNHATDFMTKSEHEEFESEISSSINDLDERKVDKESGKGLSTNDYTTAEKKKLAGIETGAQKNTVTSVAGKTGDVVLGKGDVGLGNVDNTADADKNVSHAATADDADKLDGKHSGDFLLKTEHEEFKSVIESSINDLDSRKVDKVEGKGLSKNDYTDEDKQKLAGIESGAQVNAPNTVIDANYVHTDNNYTTAEKLKLAGIESGAQKNTVTSVAGKTGDVIIGIDDVSGLQDELDSKQDNLPFTSTPSENNKVVTQKELNAAVAGTSSYLGTIDSVEQLSTNANKGDFYRVKTAWDGVHVGDMIIAEKDNPAAVIDSVNWSLMHNEMNTDTTYTFSDGTDGFSVTPSTGEKQKVKVEVKKVNGHSVESDVPANAVFTDTIIDNVSGDGITVSGTHGETISLNTDTKNAIADAKTDHTNLGGHKVSTDVPVNAVFTDTIIDNIAGDGITVSGTHGETISLDSATKTILANAKTDHTNLGGHKVSTDVPADAVFTDYKATKTGHYTPTDEKTLTPDTSVLRDTTRDMALVGTVHEDEKGHVVSVDTCAILAFTDAEIATIIEQVTAEIAEEMA